MKPAPFAYHAPRTTAEAVGLLADLAPQDGRILAGGQSLVPAMAFRLARPGHLIDINGIAAFDRIAEHDGRLEIGATVRHAAFHRPVVAGPLGALLAFVVRHIAHYPIRSRGTFCGSLAYADPASEWCLVATTLGADMVAENARGRRVIAAQDFFQGLMTTALAEDEILIAARLPLPGPALRWGFCEFSRRAGDYALTMALATLHLADGVIAEPRVGLGGAEPSARRIPEAEAVLAGRAPSDMLFRDAAEAAADAIEPMEDVQADAAYRRDLTRAMVHRALARAVA